jgi:predicted phage terminase large subunit-like protein
LESFDPRSWLATPALFACWGSKGRWRLAPHLALIDELLVDAAAGGARIAISMPPRHGKSELVSHHFPAWYLGTFPDRRVILAGYEADFAAGWGGKARDLLDRHTAAFGVRVRAESSARHRWDVDRHSGGMLTAGVGGPLTGRGADVLIIDDPIKNAEEAHSATYRDRAWDWYRSVAYTRLEPHASVIVIATRWHEDDLVGRLIQAEPDHWKVLSLPALAEDADPLGRQPGQALWPVRYPVSALEATRRVVGEYWWAAQYQQRPSPAGGGIFKRAWFRTFHDLGEAYRLGDAIIPRARCRRFCTVDLAASTSTRADYTVIGCWAVTPSNDLLLIDLVRARLEAPDILPALRRVYDQHRPAQIGIERAGYQLALIQEATRSGLPIHQLAPDGDKFSRALPAAARMEGGHIAWRGDAPWRDEFEAELLAFPHGGHDDQVDVVAYAALELARGAYQGATFGVATGVIRRPWSLDPAEQMAARLGATVYGPRVSGLPAVTFSDRSHR